MVVSKRTNRNLRDSRGLFAGANYVSFREGNQQNPSRGQHLVACCGVAAVLSKGQLARPPLRHYGKRGWTGTSMDGCFIGILIIGLVVITISLDHITANDTIFPGSFGSYC